MNSIEVLVEWGNWGVLGSGFGVLVGGLWLRCEKEKMAFDARRVLGDSLRYRRRVTEDAWSRLGLSSETEVSLARS